MKSHYQMLQENWKGITRHYVHNGNILTGCISTGILSANSQLLLRTEEGYAAKYYPCKAEIKMRRYFMTVMTYMTKTFSNNKHTQNTPEITQTCINMQFYFLTQYNQLMELLVYS